jgi:membrane associated rhomboid family serine protease
MANLIWPPSTCLARFAPHVLAMSEPRPPLSDDPELAAAPALLARFKLALNVSMATVIALAVVFFLEGRLFDPSVFSIRPQVLTGLIGVITAPLLHGSTEHLFNNAFSLLVLGTLAGTVYPQATKRALPLIWLLSGLGTWLIAQTGGGHLGASGVIHGLGFMVFMLGLLRRDRPAIAAAMIAFFFFGSMLLTVLPQELGVSWEYHLSGALAGVLAAVLWRRADPPPPRRRYSWEDEPEVAGDADTLEPPSPEQVPVLWHRPEPDPDNVLPFRPRTSQSDPNSVT